MSPVAMRMLMDYPWPGNVRELENAIEHAFVLRDQGSIELIDLPIEIRQTENSLKFSSTAGAADQTRVKGKKLSKEILLELLHECAWNKAEVGRRIGLSRTAIWKYMKKWKIPLQPPE